MLIDQVKIVDYEPFKIKLTLVDKNNLKLIDKIKKELLILTGNNWTIDLSNDDKGLSSVTEKQNLEKEKIIELAKENKIIKPLIKEFPDVKIIDVNEESKDITKD